MTGCQAASYNNSLSELEFIKYYIEIIKKWVHFSCQPVPPIVMQCIKLGGKLNFVKEKHIILLQKERGINLMKAAIEEAIRHLKNGGLAVVSDDENRENEGDLIGLGTKMSPENVNFMITQARGLLCVPVSKDIAEQLHLTQMVGNNTESNGTKFTYTIDGAFDVTGVTTGISAFDRSATIQKIAEKDASMNDFVQPGHIFPLVAENGGVLARGGHTEAAVDLAILAGEPKVGAICEIIMPNGQMARMDYLEKFANHFELPFITIEQLADYLKKHEREEIIEQSASYK